jgi:hypothetical protein
MAESEFPTPAGDPPVPAIFVPNVRAEPLSGFDRVLAAVVALIALGGLGVAAGLDPDPTGVGTHVQLGMTRCGLLARSGVPCPTCGMTTSFALFADGRFLASMWAQPMGGLLALLTAAVFWVSAYMALTARPVLRLLRGVNGGYIAFGLGGVAIAAWLFKIVVHLRGLGGV